MRGTKKGKAMKTIELTTEQRKTLVERLADVYGAFDIDIDIDDNLTINAVGNIETDGYYEDDYYNGTGAWVETYRSAWVELAATVYSEDDSETCNVDEVTAQATEKFLNGTR